MNVLYLVRGLPGSGKSTLVYLSSLGADQHFEADEFWKVRDFDPKLLGVAHAYCLTRTFEALHGGDVWVSNTFTTLAEMKPYLDMAAALGVPVKVYKCTGTWKSIHNVPESTIEAMKARWEDYPGEEEVCDGILLIRP